MSTVPEPWLRGPIAGVDPLLAPVLYSLQQVREDLARHTEGLTTEQVWAKPNGLAPLGFQLRHMAGSIDRLLTYLEGKQLDPAQIQALGTEMEPGATLQELSAGVEASLRRAEEIARRVEPSHFSEPRAVGRKQLPTTVVGLLTHIAEHTQRHLGQAILMAKLARAGAER